MKVKVGVSNRHVHLTKEAYEYLFDGKEIEKRNDLNQIGEFASFDVVDVKYDGKIIEHLRVLGPFRDRNQVELLGKDFEYLGIPMLIRRSGQLDNTPKATLLANGRALETDGVIRAEKHVHVPGEAEEDLGLHDGDRVRISDDKCHFYANVKVSDNGYFELHIDKDEASEYGITSGDELELEVCGK